MNKALKLLIYSDIVIYSGLGFIGPILAIFVKDNLIGGSISAAGLAMSIFLITYSSLQILFARIFNPKDRLWMIYLGTTIIILVQFSYILLSNIYQLYMLQFIYGIGVAFAYAAWSSMFASHLEKGQRGYQWAMDTSGSGIGGAVTAYLGALIAEKFGFHIVFIIVGIFGVISLLILLKLDKKKVLKKI